MAGFDPSADSYDEAAGVIRCANGGVAYLSTIQRLILGAVHRHGDSGIGTDGLIAAVYGGAQTPDNPANAIAVHLYHLSKRLVGGTFRISKATRENDRHRIEGRINWLAQPKGRRCPFCARPMP
jgi:hypothetical protein